nr:RNA-directed DNA polymerase, eukaryota [Tanacetum cinerariifolium]
MGQPYFDCFHSWLLEADFDKVVEDTWKMMKWRIGTRLSKGDTRLSKAKVKWAIKGDENNKYFHEIINQKRCQLAIRGILIDGEWVDDPIRVKQEFYHHFATRFEAPNWSRARILDAFPNQLSSDQYPISLIGCPYKLLGKILENMLALMIDDHVIMEQSTFIKGRQILNGPFVLNEAMAWSRRPVVFVFIPSSHGKPSCFHLEDCETWPIFTNSSRELPKVTLSNLFYADDAIFIGEWSHDNMISIARLLQCFYMASGLNVNFHKSMLLGIDVTYHEVECMAPNVGCNAEKMSFNYHGVKVGENMSRIESWRELNSKVSNKLSSWKIKTSSVGGRLTLLKSVLGSLPTYYMSIYKAPQAVVKYLESICNSWVSPQISLDKLPTRINLDVRGFDVPSILCPICDSDVDFISTMVRLVYESSAKEDAKDSFGGFVVFAFVARLGS